MNVNVVKLNAFNGSVHAPFDCVAAPIEVKSSLEDVRTAAVPQTVSGKVRLRLVELVPVFMART